MIVFLLDVTEAIEDVVHVVIVGIGHVALQGFEFVVQVTDTAAACDGFIEDRTPCISSTSWRK